ncbi:CAP domain-containing protein [Maribacter halichondriae]|uniref:CAP domain-containing protein n=1 Tax=Maribacter halichondriae TaxID=2980554 RepID=UPI002359C7EC|nr:CAP domain-containing protein [Maribacter sp. Hal144]
MNLKPVCRKARYTFLACFLLVLASCSKETIDTIEIPKAENDAALEQALLGIVNDHRTALGYTSLEYSTVAYEYANLHNDYMIAKGGISHDNFSARASNIASEVNAEFVAENVAKDYTSAAEAFQGWLESSSHKKTMEGEFTHTAVSVKKDANGTFYYTQLFFR